MPTISKVGPISLILRHRWVGQLVVSTRPLKNFVVIVLIETAFIV